MIYRYKGLKKKTSPFHTRKGSNYTLLPGLAIYNCKYSRGWAHSSEVVNWYMCESAKAFCNFLMILNEKWNYNIYCLCISYYDFKITQVPALKMQTHIFYFFTMRLPICRGLLPIDHTHDADIFVKCPYICIAFALNNILTLLSRSLGQ